MTTIDLMNQASDALKQEDAIALWELLEVVKGWLQTEEELDAQVNMLKAMLGSLGEV